MSAPTFLIDPERAGDAAIGATFLLDGAEGRHAVAVQRIRPGERLDLVDGSGTRASAEVIDTDKDSCTVRIDAVEHEPAPHPVITAVQAIAKGDRGELAVQMLTETGIDVIVPWRAAHCVVKWDDDRAAKNHAKWQATARESAKQSRRSRIPRVESLSSTAAVADLIANADVAFVLDEQSTIPLTSIDISAVGDITLVIGPEGGLSDIERELFAESGGDLVTLGGNVLRTSTAGVAALSVISAATGRW